MRLSSLMAAAAACLLVLACAPAAGAANGVNVDLTAQLQGSYTSTNDLGSVVFNFNQRAFSQLAPGTATGRADRLFSDTRTIAASGTENLDLAGTLTDPFGATLTFVKVKAIYIKAAAANTNNVCVGGHATAAFTGPFSDVTDIICIPPGGVLMLVHPGAGWTVTATTGDMLKVTNSSSGTGVTYDVLILGTSA